mgnify:CR=1 FL=1
MIAPGGTLVYAVCSLQDDEGPARVDALVGRTPSMRRDPVRPEELPGLEEAITPKRAVRTLPSMWADRGGLDGFYIARLKKAP